jgi:DNA-binding response OmpR family regulator
MKKQARVLLVEDDGQIARIICDYLRKDGFSVAWASTGKEGLEEFASERFDLVLVDLMLPEIDGFTLLRTIRKTHEIPMLIVSARSGDESKVKGLNLGADDYITKPFSLEELSARISSHLRRYRRYQGVRDSSEPVSYMNGLTIDFDQKSVHLGGQLLNLTAKEWELLHLLAKNPFETFSKEALLEMVWKQEDISASNTVTVHIKSLRSKLKDISRSAVFIQTVWGAGYRFIGEEKDEN